MQGHFYSPYIEFGHQLHVNHIMPFLYFQRHPQNVPNYLQFLCYQKDASVPEGCPSPEPLHTFLSGLQANRQSRSIHPYPLTMQFLSLERLCQRVLRLPQYCRDSDRGLVRVNPEVIRQLLHRVIAAQIEQPCHQINHVTSCPHSRNSRSNPRSASCWVCGHRRRNSRSCCHGSLPDRSVRQLVSP